MDQRMLIWTLASACVLNLDDPRKVPFSATHSMIIWRQKISWFFNVFLNTYIYIYNFILFFGMVRRVSLNYPDFWQEWGFLVSFYVSPLFSFGIMEMFCFDFFEESFFILLSFLFSSFEGLWHSFVILLMNFHLFISL